MGKPTTKATAGPLRQLDFSSKPIDSTEPTDASRNARFETLASCGLLLLTYFLLAALAG